MRARQHQTAETQAKAGSLPPQYGCFLACFFDPARVGRHALVPTCRGFLGLEILEKPEPMSEAVTVNKDLRIRQAFNLVALLHQNQVPPRLEKRRIYDVGYMEQ